MLNLTRPEAMALIRHLRTEAGLTQAQLADQINEVSYPGITRFHVSHAENNADTRYDYARTACLHVLTGDAWKHEVRWVRD